MERDFLASSSFIDFLVECTAFVRRLFPLRLALLSRPQQPLASRIRQIHTVILVDAVSCQLSHVLLAPILLPPKENCCLPHAAKYWMSGVEKNVGGRLSKDERLLGRYVPTRRASPRSPHSA